jgi:hypothetical protein
MIDRADAKRVHLRARPRQHLRRKPRPEFVTREDSSNDRSVTKGPRQASSRQPQRRLNPRDIRAIACGQRPLDRAPRCVDRLV